MVCEKAIDEPRLCAIFCYFVSCDFRWRSNSSFKTLLITKCQNEFLGIVTGNWKTERFWGKCEEANDPEKIAEYRERNQDEERKRYRRSIGIVRFIGELFQTKILTANIMSGCLQSLLDQTSEDKLEFMCALLTIIGNRLEHRTSFINKYFQQLHEIVEEAKISSSVRCMIQDVIDLRKNNWISLPKL